MARHSDVDALDAGHGHAPTADMRLFRRRRADRSPAASPERDQKGVEIAITLAPPPHPACSQCGRTDLPLVDGWDPPICQDCDAAINEDAMWSEEV